MAIGIVEARAEIGRLNDLLRGWDGEEPRVPKEYIYDNFNRADHHT